MALKKRALGRTGLEVSELGFGGWGIGGDEHGNSLGPTDDATSRAAIESAIAAGVTFFDTADVYGHGRSERLIGESVAALGKRGDVVIATKAGAVFTGGGSASRRYDFDYLKGALERSLERLRTDRLDVFQLHDPGLEVIRAPETHDAVRRLKETGLARAIGVTFHTIQEGNAIFEAGVFDTIQVMLNVAIQWVAIRFLEPARARGVGFIAREPLAQGFLSGRYAPDHAFPPGDVRAGWSPHYRTYVEGVVAKMRQRFHEDPRARTDRSLAAIALQFVLAHEDVSTVITSMKSPRHVEENARAAALPPLTTKEFRWLRE
jgi:aryl-alcohol dehydrogenase-like predicted oxidoreductase